MKKSWIILNIAIIVAVAGLYVLHFTGDKTASKGENSQTTIGLNTSNISKAIYYINFDTVLANYDRYLDMQDQLEKMAKTSEAELAAQDKAFQKPPTAFSHAFSILQKRWSSQVWFRFHPSGNGRKTP